MDNKFDLKKFLAENKKSEVLQEEWDEKAVQRAADHQGKDPEQIKKDVDEHEHEDIAMRFTKKYSQADLGRAIVNGHYDGDLKAAFEDLDEDFDY